LTAGARVAPPASRLAPIGVFDSGVGGLTVLAALAAQLPGEDFIYLGDTARLPYGTKSARSVEQYALQASAALVARGIKALVIACNTAASVALPALRARFAGLPVIGVVEPGAEAACAATRSGRIAVLATEATVAGGAYERAIHARLPHAEVVSIACPLFVALAEEGWTQGEVAEAAARRYLVPLHAAGQLPDVLVLGCTHFPMLAGVIGAAVGPGVTLVDSALTTARATRRELETAGLVRDAQWQGSLKFIATDGAARFARVGARFLDRPLAAASVEIIDLGPATTQSGNG
jgi:glutamate racemase